MTINDLKKEIKTIQDNIMENQNKMNWKDDRKIYLLKCKLYVQVTGKMYIPSNITKAQYEEILNGLKNILNYSNLKIKHSYNVEG